MTVTGGSIVDWTLLRLSSTVQFQLRSRWFEVRFSSFPLTDFSVAQPTSWLTLVELQLRTTNSLILLTPVGIGMAFSRRTQISINFSKTSRKLSSTYRHTPIHRTVLSISSMANIYFIQGLVNASGPNLQEGPTTASH